MRRKTLGFGRLVGEFGRERVNGIPVRAASLRGSRLMLGSLSCVERQFNLVQWRGLATCLLLVLLQGVAGATRSELEK